MMLAQTMLETLSMASGKGVHPKELFATVNDRLREKNVIYEACVVEKRKTQF